MAFTAERSMFASHVFAVTYDWALHAVMPNIAHRARALAIVAMVLQARTGVDCLHSGDSFVQMKACPGVLRRS